ncbi:hypothetical protein GCM10009836_43820 [Pseudonocardia ailaonensis]|uniref:Uncharacterized protein n=1 Tax=Pseudonocardia ailaonensis TaxID=367279 RepID=A0ABN2NDE4_9PSEU
MVWWVQPMAAAAFACSFALTIMDGTDPLATVMILPPGVGGFDSGVKEVGRAVGSSGCDVK